MKKTNIILSTILIGLVIFVTSCSDTDKDEDTNRILEYYSTIEIEECEYLVGIYGEQLATMERSIKPSIETSDLNHKHMDSKDKHKKLMDKLKKVDLISDKIIIVTFKIVLAAVMIMSFVKVIIIFIQP